MDPITDHLYKRILKSYPIKRYKSWSKIPYCQSECGQYVRSNFKLNESNLIL